MNLRYATILFCAIFAVNALADSELKPLFTLNGQAKSVPFLVDYAKDQGVYKIASQKEFKNSIRKIAKIKNTIQKYANRNAKQKAQHLYDYFFAMSEICYYHFTSRLKFTLSRDERRCHAELIKVGRVILKNDKDGNNRIIYNVALSYFALRKYRKARHYFQMLMTNSNRSPLRRRAELLSYVIDLEVKKSMSILSYNRLISKLDKRGRLIVDLVTARFLAGINLSGELEGNVSSRYSSYIRKVAPQVADLPTNHQEEILIYIVGIIRRAKGKINWSKFPIRIETFSYTPSYAALLERKALHAYHLKRYNVAARYYKHLLPMAAATQKTRAVRRFLNLSAQQFAKDKSVDGYKKAIVFSSAYLKAASEQEFFQKHIARLVAVIAKTVPKLTKQQLKTTLSIVKLLASLRRDTQVAMDSKLVMAKIYLRLDSLRDAVDMYYHLYTLSDKKSSQFLDLAIKYQHKLAKWPRQLVWNPLPSILHNQRTLLKKLLEEKALLLADKHDWEITAMVGLLAINLKVKSVAYGLWLKNAHHKHPSIPDIAFGVMLDDYLKSAKWFDIEKIVELSLRSGINPKKPQTAKQYFPLKKIYADALFNTSRLYSKMGKQDESYKQATEFLKSFPEDKRQPENVFRLADIMLKTKKYVKAMEYFSVLINDYKDSAFYQHSLLIAGGLAKRQGRAKQAASFYGMFLRSFPNSPEIKKIVYELVYLYRGNLLYDELRFTYNFIISSDKFSLVEKQRAELWSMQLENKKGNKNVAQLIAHKVLANSNQSHQHKAIAIAILAETSYEKQDLKALRSLKSKLNSKLPVYQNVYNQLAYYIAATTVYLTEQASNTAQSSPDKYLQYLIKSFANERDGYLEACRFTNSNFCLPAFIGLVNKSVSYQDAVKVIEPLATAETAAVVALNAKKKQFIAYLEDQKKFFTKRTLHSLRSGNALSEWLANAMLLFPDLSLRYVDGYFAEADFVQFDAVGNI
ncbi:MAG: tetratricopeptide repeat protein [Pseudomonadota bacterium]|nr:tetratricopeptide repeat protein [Pseudomonadota bacterium]